MIAKKSMRFSSAPVKIAPRPKLIGILQCKLLSRKRETQEYSGNFENAQGKTNDKNQKSEPTDSRLKARLAARVKVKKAKARERCKHLPLLKPSPSLRLWIVWNTENCKG